MSDTTAEPPRLSDIVARFVAGIDPAAIPEATVASARVALIDTIGVMLAGSQEHHARLVQRLVAEEAGAPVATIAGTGLRAPPRAAALANGTASHGIDFDLSYLMGQPSASLVPALLAVAESRRSTARDLLAAYVIGFEITSRLCRANPDAANLGNWHAVAAIGPIASAVACAWLMRAAPATIPDVIGVATAMASGTQVNFGTMTKPLHAGHGAHCAVTAATLGAAGYTASPLALEARNGYFGSFGRGLRQEHQVFAELGVRWDLVERGIAIKPYPCGGLAHPAIDAVLELREALGGATEAIAAVQVGITRFAARNIKTTYPHTAEAAKFSAPYITAATLIHGAPRIATFTEAAIEEPAVRALATKVAAGIDTSLGDPIESPLPARVTITLTDGRRLERMRDYALGHPMRPMSAAQLEAKFFDCADQALPRPRAERLLALLSTLDGETTLDGLWPLLRPE